MGVENIIPANDMARYRELIQSVELTDSQRDEIIAIVHSVMQSFIDSSFEQDSVQINQREKALKSFFEKADSANLRNSFEPASLRILPRDRAKAFEP